MSIFVRLFLLCQEFVNFLVLTRVKLKVYKSLSFSLINFYVSGNRFKMKEIVIQM